MSPKQKEQIKALKKKMRYEGDHAHNMAVRSNNRGELLIVRNPTSFDSRDYKPCPMCL